MEISKGLFTNKICLKIPAWKSNYMLYEMWEYINNPFPNFNGTTVEIRELSSNFMPHFTECVITYPCWD